MSDLSQTQDVTVDPVQDAATPLTDNLVKPPAEWKTGADAATTAQLSHLETIAGRQAVMEVLANDPTKAGVSQAIDAARTNAGLPTQGGEG
jgi:hypothetical protein